jgi:hypothetical protein
MNDPFARLPVVPNFKRVGLLALGRCHAWPTLDPMLRGES